MAETSIDLEVISFRFFVLVLIYVRVESLDSHIKVGFKENKSSNVEQSLESRTVTNSRFL